MFNSNQICFFPEAGDTHSFGSSIAINDKYLIVGDPGANRVVVYQKNIQDQWYRKNEIYPPENSISYERQNGFGINLILGENTLIVTSWSTEKVTDKTNLSRPSSIFRGQYLIQLDQEKEVVPIELYIDKKKVLLGFIFCQKINPS